MNASRDDGGRRSFSILQRGTIALAMMILLVAAAGGIGLSFAFSVERNIRAMQRGTDQAVRVSDLQRKWLGVVGILDTLSVTRPTAATKEQLEKRLADLNQELEAISAQPLGLSPEKIAENQKIAEELKQVGAETTVLVKEISDLVEQNRWGTALQKRQTAMAALQGRLDESLTRLNANIESDVAWQAEQVRRLQALNRMYWIVSVVLAVGLAAVTGIIARRTVIQPIGKLIAQVERITQGDFSPVIPLPQQDEIGELSRAIALMTDWLRDSYEMLEKRVAERTQGLERRTTQFQVAAQVARDITVVHDLEDLLNRAVNLIRDRFGYYHAGIFLIDQRREYAVLRAATGEAGYQMLSRKHKLRIGETGLVGNVTSTGKPRIALDVGQDAVHFKNPLLPETRSEVALPLKVGDYVIGALDVQSQEAAAFDEERLAVLQVMADQLAIAIQNTQLLQEVQDNLSELEAAYGRFGRQAWQRFAQTSPIIGYEFNGVNAAPILREGSRATKSRPTGTGPLQRPASIPLKLRGEVIGSLEVWPQEGELSEEDLALLTNLSSRIGQILDSARLFEDAQVRAAREQMINRLTASIARALDTDGVLRAAARELGELPTVSEASIYLGPVLAGMETPAMQSPETKAAPDGNGHEPAGNGQEAR